MNTDYTDFSLIYIQSVFIRENPCPKTLARLFSNNSRFSPFADSHIRSYPSLKARRAVALIRSTRKVRPTKTMSVVRTPW